MTTDRIFTIAPDRPFVDDLARALLDEVANAPERLAAHRVLLPTRRACRSLREAAGDPRTSPAASNDADRRRGRRRPVPERPDPGRLLSSGPPLDPDRRTSLPNPACSNYQPTSPGTQPRAAVEWAAELALLLDRIQTSGFPASIPKHFPPNSAHWEGYSVPAYPWPTTEHSEGRGQTDCRPPRPGTGAPPLAETSARGSGHRGGINRFHPCHRRSAKTVAELPEGAVVLPGSIKGWTRNRGICWNLHLSGG